MDNTQGQYNTRCAGVRRLMQEAKELQEPTELYHAQPFDENLFEWHFTVRGPADSEFDGGIYHGRILFPPDYPMKPPNIILLTPNGRFELNKKICLSISGYHPETWLPSWSIRTALLALIGFMPTNGAGAIGSVSYPPEERKKLAALSAKWQCKECGATMKEALKPLGEEGRKTETEARALIQAKPAQSTEQGAAAPAAEAAIPEADDAAPAATPPVITPEVVGGIGNRRRVAQSSTDWTFIFLVSFLVLCIALFIGLSYRKWSLRQL